MTRPLALRSVGVSLRLAKNGISYRIGGGSVKARRNRNPRRGRARSSDVVSDFVELTEDGDDGGFESRRREACQLRQHLASRIRQAEAGGSRSHEWRPIHGVGRLDRPVSPPCSGPVRRGSRDRSSSSATGATPVDELLVEDREVGAVVANRASVILEPREFESSRTHRPLKRKCRCPLAEMQDGRHDCYLAVEDVIEGSRSAMLPAKCRRFFFDRTLRRPSRRSGRAECRPGRPTDTTADPADRSSVTRTIAASAATSRVTNFRPRCRPCCRIPLPGKLIHPRNCRRDC